MTKGPSILLAATALFLAACGSPSEKEVASGSYTDPDTGETADYKLTTSADGDEGKVSIKTADGEMSFGGGAAAKLPAGFTPYPGSKMTGGMATTGKDGASGLASFEVEGKAADVIAHFRKQAEGAGMKITSEVSAGDTLMFGAEKTGEGKNGVHVPATQEGGTVTGAVTYGGG